MPPQSELANVLRGGLRKAGGEMWRARQDSNPQPLGPKPSALSIELQALAIAVTLALTVQNRFWGERRGSNP